MKVKEFIKNLLDEDMEAEIVILAKNNGGEFQAVDIYGISGNYRAYMINNMIIGSICIEPMSEIITKN